jgi:hypothetical protein
VATCTTTTGTSIGSSSTSPYSLTWDSQPVDGDYKVVANALDAAGNAKRSDAVTTTVDNTAPTASDAQATAATTSGANTIGSGDVIKLTFSEIMNPATIKAGLGRHLGERGRSGQGHQQDDRFSGLRKRDRVGHSRPRKRQLGENGQRQ